MWVERKNLSWLPTSSMYYVLEWGRVLASDDSDIWCGIFDILVHWEQSLWLGSFPFQVLLLLLSHCVVSDSCKPLDCSLATFSVHGMAQARILEWVAISSPGDLPDPGIEPVSPAWQADSLPLSHQGSPFKFCASGLKKYSKSLYNGELTLQAVGLYKLCPLINLLSFFF